MNTTTNYRYWTSDIPSRLDDPRHQTPDRGVARFILVPPRGFTSFIFISIAQHLSTNSACMPLKNLDAEVI